MAVQIKSTDQATVSSVKSLISREKEPSVVVERGPRGKVTKVYEVESFHSTSRRERLGFTPDIKYYKEYYELEDGAVRKKLREQKVKTGSSTFAKGKVEEDTYDKQGRLIREIDYYVQRGGDTKVSSMKDYNYEKGIVTTKDPRARREAKEAWDADTQTKNLFQEHFRAKARTAGKKGQARAERKAYKDYLERKGNVRTFRNFESDVKSRLSDKQRESFEAARVKQQVEVLRLTSPSAYSKYKQSYDEAKTTAKVETFKAQQAASQELIDRQRSAQTFNEALRKIKREDTPLGKYISERRTPFQLGKQDPLIDRYGLATGTRLILYQKELDALKSKESPDIKDTAFMRTTSIPETSRPDETAKLFQQSRSSPPLKPIRKEKVRNDVTPFDAFKKFREKGEIKVKGVVFGSTTQIPESSKQLIGKEGLANLKYEGNPYKVYEENIPTIKFGLETGARTYIADKPERLVTAATVGIGFGLGSGLLSSLGTTGATTSSLVGRGLGTLYAGSKGIEAYKRGRQEGFVKGVSEVAGETAVELGAFGVGAKGTGQAIKNVGFSPKAPAAWSRVTKKGKASAILQREAGRKPSDIAGDIYYGTQERTFSSYSPTIIKSYKRTSLQSRPGEETILIREKGLLTTRYTYRTPTEPTQVFSSSDGSSKGLTTPSGYQYSTTQRGKFFLRSATDPKGKTTTKVYKGDKYLGERVSDSQPQLKFAADTDLFQEKTVKIPSDYEINPTKAYLPEFRSESTVIIRKSTSTYLDPTKKYKPYGERTSIVKEDLLVGTTKPSYELVGEPVINLDTNQATIEVAGLTLGKTKYKFITEPPKPKPVRIEGEDNFAKLTKPVESRTDQSVDLKQRFSIKYLRDAQPKDKPFLTRVPKQEEKGTELGEMLAATSKPDPKPRLIYGKQGQGKQRLNEPSKVVEKSVQRMVSGTKTKSPTTTFTELSPQISKTKSSTVLFSPTKSKGATASKSKSESVIKTKTRNIQREAMKTRVNTETLLNTATASMVLTKTKTKTLTQQRTKQLTQQLTQQQVTRPSQVTTLTTPKPTPPPPPPPTPLDLPFPSSSRKKKGSVKGVKGVKFKGQYVASVEAIMFNIRGKANKKLAKTGVTLRPLKV